MGKLRVKNTHRLRLELDDDPMWLLPFSDFAPAAVDRQRELTKPLALALTVNEHDWIEGFVVYTGPKGTMAQPCFYAGSIGVFMYRPCKEVIRHFAYTMLVWEENPSKILCPRFHPTRTFGREIATAFEDNKFVRVGNFKKGQLLDGYLLGDPMGQYVPFVTINPADGEMTIHNLEMRQNARNGHVSLAAFMPMSDERKSELRSNFLTHYFSTPNVQMSGTVTGRVSLNPPTNKMRPKMSKTPMFKVDFAEIEQRVAAMFSKGEEEQEIV